MKHFLICLFSIIVGELLERVFRGKFPLSRHFFFSPVFSLYRSLSADDSNRIENDVDYVYGSVKGNNKDKDELKAAQLKIRQLEQRLAGLEERLPKKYEEVRKLNYQSRKRILVRKLLKTQSSFTVKFIACLLVS
jgi:hypothetical protein